MADEDVMVTDEFGRTEAERTIALTPEDAEAVGQEVEYAEKQNLKHSTFAKALGYIIERGLAEIARARASQMQTKLDKEIRKILESSPELRDTLPQDVREKLDQLAKLRKVS